MGKSSLASFLKNAAEVKDEFLGVHSFVGGADTVEEVTRRVLECVIRETRTSPMWERLKGFFGSRIQEIGILGINVAFNPSQDEIEQLSRNILPALKSLYEKVKDERKGLLVILDDVNGVAADAKFANFLKSLVDEASISNEPVPFMLVLVALPEIQDKLLEAQPSIGRIFEVIEVRPLTAEETRNFYKKAFRSSGMTYQDEAIDMLARFAGGYPMLIHELGDSTFWADKDWKIDMDDAVKGLIEAVERVGRKYLERQVLNAIRSDKYRSIIEKLLSGPEIRSRFQKQEIEKKLTNDEKSVFNNFLQRMKKLGVLKSGDSKGEYIFANELFYLYMKLVAVRSKKTSPINGWNKK